MSFRVVYLFSYASMFFVIFIIVPGTDYPTGGDDTLQVFTSKPNLNGGDTVGTINEGLVWFKEGFNITAVNDGADYVIMSTPISVSKEFSYSASSDIVLVLNNSLDFIGDCSLGGSGKFDFGLGSAMRIFGTFNLLSNTLTISQSAIHSSSYNNGTISGDGNVVEFGGGGVISWDQPNLSGSDYDFYFSNLYLSNLHANSFYSNPRGCNLNIHFRDVTLHLVEDVYIGGMNSLVIEGNVFVTGRGYKLCIDTQLKMLTGSRLTFDIGTTCSLGYHCDFDVLSGAQLVFDGCRIEMGENIGFGIDINEGVELENGIALFDNKVTIDDAGNNKAFQLKGSSEAVVLSNAMVVLEGTTTFSAV